MLINFVSLRADKSKLVSVLNAAGANVQGKRCACPFHAKSARSGEIYKTESGAWHFLCNSNKCRVSGDVIEVMSQLDGVSRDVIVAKLRRAESSATNSELIENGEVRRHRICAALLSLARQNPYCSPELVERMENRVAALAVMV